MAREKGEKSATKGKDPRSSPLETSPLICAHFRSRENVYALSSQQFVPYPQRGRSDTRRGQPVGWRPQVMSERGGTPASADHSAPNSQKVGTPATGKPIWAVARDGVAPTPLRLFGKLPTEQRICRTRASRARLKLARGRQAHREEKGFSREKPWVFPLSGALLVLFSRRREKST